MTVTVRAGLFKQSQDARLNDGRCAVGLFCECNFVGVSQLLSVKVLLNVAERFLHKSCGRWDNFKRYLSEVL